MRPGDSDPLDWIDGELTALEARSLRRALTTHEGPQQATLSFDGRQLVNFGSNDYLGLSADPRLREAAARAAESEGWGAGASPLVTGHAQAHRRLEQRLAEFEGTEAALVFSSGYAANMGAISALVGRSDAIYSDAGNHASMIDGCRLSRAAVHIYPHGDAAALEALLRSGTSYRRRLIVTESVFSMEGDLAPLLELAALAARFECMLLVDEAHATGVFGARGRGLAEHLGVEDRVHVRVGTLSKALGCVGGFVCGRESLIQWLVNRARPYIFSTASPPAASAAAVAALDIVDSEPWRRTTLRDRSTALASQLREQGWSIGGSASHVIPLVIGDAAATMRLAGQLREQGILVPGVRPPSVAPGRSLLRISLSYAHTSDQIAQLLDALAGLRDAVASNRVD